MTTSEKAAAPSKDIWEILRTLATIVASVASIAVPLVIAWVGGVYNANIKDSENRIRYVELAIAQLRSPPTPETAALRDWALELLDSQSPIKLSPEAKSQLKSNALTIPIQLSGKGTAVAGGTATLSVTEPTKPGAATSSAPGQ